MELYKHKFLDVEFIILSLEGNASRLHHTVRTINRARPDAKIICIAAKEVPTSETKEMKKHCPVFRGGDTVISLLNTGFKRGGKEWNMFLMEGVTFRQGAIRTMSLFVEDEKDIVFPIAVEYDRQGIPKRLNNKFSYATLNGLMIHQKTFKDIGEFIDFKNVNRALELSKLFWEAHGTELGCKFKAVLGVKMI